MLGGEPGKWGGGQDIVVCKAGKTTFGLHACWLPREGLAHPAGGFSIKHGNINELNLAIPLVVFFSWIA
jgi:hypothetical protein